MKAGQSFGFGATVLSYVWQGGQFEARSGGGVCTRNIGEYPRIETMEEGIFCFQMF